MVSYPFIIFQVNGAVVNVRSKGDKLAVWLADAGEQEQESVTRIGRMIKERRGVDYLSFCDSMCSTSRRLSPAALSLN